MYTLSQGVYYLLNEAWRLGRYNSWTDRCVTVSGRLFICKLSLHVGVSLFRGSKYFVTPATRGPPPGSGPVARGRTRDIARRWRADKNRRPQFDRVAVRSSISKFNSVLPYFTDRRRHFAPYQWNVTRLREQQNVSTVEQVPGFQNFLRRS